MDYINKILKEIYDLLDEAQFKRVVRKGKVVKKGQCPDGQKFDPSRKKCVKMTASEKVKRKKGTKIAAKKSKHKMAKTLKKRQKSIKKHVRQIGEIPRNQKNITKPLGEQ